MQHAGIEMTVLKRLWESLLDTGFVLTAMIEEEIETNGVMVGDFIGQRGQISPTDLFNPLVS